MANRNAAIERETHAENQRAFELGADTAVFASRVAPAVTRRASLYSLNSFWAKWYRLLLISAVS